LIVLLFLLLQVRDAGNLLTRADLAMPTVDIDTFVMRYSSAVSLVSHLRLMAESNALQVGGGGGGTVWGCVEKGSRALYHTIHLETRHLLGGIRMHLASNAANAFWGFNS
jgi:hypothetical protein